ncbi:MAG: gliding motility-associated C-terminal domain-containing protein [Flavobacterium sp. JAD_PAG50586_2]|nr:MAG: gliding motility-associated C-terminal domain-containing protein [Flavobacterium sp. JAD_PAG50586_2]
MDGEDYFADDNTGTCGTRQSVVVRIYSAPTGANFQGVCVTNANQATPSNPQFVISGNGLRWYTVPSGGTAISNSTILSDNTIYYISQTNPDTGCETSRLQLFVNVGVVPVPTGAAVQEFCNVGTPPTVGDLVASGNNNWYLTSTFGVPLDAATPLVNSQFYYATTVDPPCESTDRLQVLVNIYEPNDAGSNGNRSICVSQIPTTPAFNLFNLLGGSPDNTGVWTGPIATSNGAQGTLNPSSMTVAGSPYVFTYTVSSALCATDTSTVTVIINPTPTVTVTSPTICQGATATVTATPSPAGTYAYVWTVPTGAANPGNVATFTTTTAGVYSVVITNTNTTCPSQPGQTTLLINPRPTVTVTSPPVCQGTPATVTATPIPAGTYNYSWTVPIGATNPGNVATFTTTTAGVYSIIITNPTTSCSSLPAQVTVVINTPPTVTVTSPPVCQGSPATVTATPNPAGTYSYIWTVPTGATNPGNVSTFTTTIAGVYSVIATNTNTNCPSQPGQTTVVINPRPTVTVTSAPVCQGTPATVTATPTPAGTYTYSWTVPTGATNPGNVATFTTTISGVYSVIITNSTTTCASLPAQTTVVINTRPTVTVTSPPVCLGTPATVTATPNPAGTYTYTWTVPAGATNPGNVSTFATTIAGVYSVIITNQTTTCASLPAQTTVVINPTPTVTVTSAPVCQGTPATVTATPTPAGTYTYSWTVPIGATNPGNVATFTTTTAGVYSVIITNPTTSCPSQPGQTTVVINPRPTVTVTSPPVCQGTPATVTATPTPAGTYTYTWTVPTGATNPGNVATFTTTTAGVYSVIITNPTTTCPSQPAQTTVVINPRPTVTVTSTPVCQGTPAIVTATPTPAGTYTYTWTVPTGVANPGNVATFTTSTPGVYSVIITNPTTTCPSQPGQTTVVINPRPIVTVTSPPVCQGTPATVTATPTPSGTYTYTWTVPTGATNPGNVATFTTTTAGVYSVIITNPTTTCLSQPGQTTVVINPRPIVTVTSPPVCQGTPATVTATPTPAGTYTYTWTVPAGATNPGNVSTFATTIAGVYSVIITNQTTTCASLPAQTTVVINPTPTVTVTSAPVCQGTPATVTATPTPAGTYTYIWTVPTGATNPGNVASFTTTTAGVYSVIITNPTTTCPSQPGQTTVVINPTPTVAVTSPPVCQGTPATVTATPTPAGTYTYTWTVPIGATNPGNVATFTTTTSGVYSVIIANPTTTCPSQPGQTTVVINPAPTVAVTSAPVCQGSPATVTATPTPAGTYTYTWTVPTGATNPGNVATFTTTTPGIYSVIITSPSTTCPSQPGQTTVVINPIPTIAVTSTPVCQGTPSTITAIPTPAGTYSYVWTVPTGAPNPGNVATFTTTTPGVYIVIATNAISTCPSQPAQTTVVINPTPTVTVASPPVCQGTPATVTATPTPAGTYSYVWTVPTGATNPGNVATFTTTTAGVYNVIATSTSTTCPSQPGQTTVVINPTPTVAVTSAPVCQGTPATVTATPTPAGIYTYTWTVPIGATNPGNVATFTTTTAGVYSVIIANLATTCPSQQAQTTVVINPKPTVAVTSPPVCQGTPATVTATPTPAGTYTYTWTVPTGATNPGNVATFTTTTAGVYSVIITNPATTCPSQPAQTTVVINPTPTVAVTSATVCQGTPATVTATPTPTGTYTYTWTVPIGATNPGNVATFTTTTAGIYSVIITNSSTTCPSQPGQTTVIINPVPNAGNDGTLNICSNQNPVDLFDSLLGTPQTGGTWSPALTSGTGIFNPAVDAQGVYTYTITGIAPCADDTATVTVTVTPGPEAGADNSLTVCVNNPAQDLFLLLGPTAQTGGTWSPAMASGTGFFDPAVDPQGDYVYTLSGTLPCSNDFATISVTVNPIPDAGTNGTKAFCSNGTPQDLFLSLGGTPQAGGTWSPALTSGNGMFDPTVDPTGVYIYTVGSTCITPSTATVSVTIVTAPNAGVSHTLNTCANVTSLDLFTGLDGTQNSGGNWADDDATGALANNIFNPSSVGVGTYHFTYTVPGTLPCANATSTVTVIVNPLPNAGAAIAAPSVCTSVGTIDLNTLLTGQDAGGTWSATTPVNISGFAQGTYTYTYTVTNSCGVDAQPVQFIVLPNPILTTTNVTSSQACVGTDVTVTLTGMTDGTYNLNYSLIGSNTLANQTATVIISGGTGSFIIPAATVPNTGTTTITFNTIQDPTTTCQVTLVNIIGTITISPLVQVDNADITVSSVCLGSDATVVISGAADLPDGVYQFNYVIPTGTPATGNSGDVTITGGDGQFTIPSSVFGGVGNYTITISGITTPTGCSNPAEDANITFAVVAPLTAGTFSGIVSVCTSSATLDLTTLLTGQDTGGTWTDSSSVVVISPLDISAFTAGDYTYTYTVTSLCGTDTEDVQFTILPSPLLTPANITINPVCIGVDVVVDFSTMVDGTYTLNYDLTGNNTLANQTATVVISGGIGSFTIPAANVPIAGPTIITFNSILDTVSTCQSTLTNVSATITINPIADIDNTDITVSNICLGSDATVAISGAANLPDGVYQFNYVIPAGTPATGNSGNVTVTGGNGQFIIPASVFATAGSYTITINEILAASGCSNTSENANLTFNVETPITAGTFTGIVSICASVGVFDLTTLLTGQSAGGVWTDSASAVVTSPLTIISFTAGTYSYTYTVTNACGTDTEVVQFTVLATPVLTTVNVTISPNCVGTDATVNLTGMVDGTYTLNYDLTGSNTLAGQTVVVTITAGIGSFTVPTASIPNVGITVITFTSIVNNATTCASTLINVASQIIVTPVADIDNANLSIANICLGSNVVVNITGATNLPDGVYQFNYSIPGATPVTGNSGNVTMTGGAGSFTVAAASFTAAGNYTLTVTGIIASSGCSNANENATANFTINLSPSMNGATMTAQDTCINNSSNVTISGITNLPDGTYTLSYQLAGANTASGTLSVLFTNGGATFTIPGTDIVNNGATSIQMTNLTSPTLTCAVGGGGTLIANFNVIALPTPVLITDGYQFCGSDVPAPTIADLSANIVGTPTMIWYDAITGGTAYNNTDLLVDGATYYGAEVSQSGCESSRLAVQVDLTFCDIKIPDGFSPNNDGINDTFEIPNLAILYPNFKMEIYNRYGNLVYKGNINVPNWDGTTKEGGVKLGDNLLPTGVYFYILDFSDGIKKAIQGRLYLNR